VPARLIVTAAATLCGVLLLTSCGGSSRGRDDFVIVSTRDGSYELYVMNADGSHQHRLTSGHPSSSSAAGLYYELDPAWSPNGQRIAFASWRDGGRSHIFVVDANGKNTTQLTSGSKADSHPTWSPDGAKIAFVRGASGIIEVMNADGTHVHQISAGADGSAGDPAWSPNGRWIAYDLEIPGGTTRALWLVHPDGSGRHRLIAGSATAISPTWSPDSRRIAFSSDNGSPSSTLAIYEINVSGRGLQLVARPDQAAIDPAWSPDGNLIAFSTDGAITTVDFAANFTQLTNPKNNDRSPAWNPKPPPEKKKGS
jgi:Tol biopolymer transport system component